MLGKPWVVGNDPTRQPDCKYWTMLVSLNYWNIIPFTNKLTTKEDFDALYKVVLDCTSDNMSTLVHNGKCGAINTADPTTIGSYVVKLLSEPYM